MSFIKKMTRVLVDITLLGCYNSTNKPLFAQINYPYCTHLIVRCFLHYSMLERNPMYTEDNNHGIYIEKRVRVPSFTMSYEHVHEYCEIFYLKSGSCIYSVNGNLYHLTAGDVFLVTPGDYHCTRYEGLVPCERVVVYCLPSVLPEDYMLLHSDISEKLSRSGKVVLVKKGQLQLENILERMLEENNIPDEYSHELLKLQMMTLLLILKRNGIFVYEQLKHRDNISTDIEDALRYIAQNFSLPLTLDEVAEKINLTPTYLSKKFKKVTGVTFKEYVNFIRIRQACQMLLTTDDSITTIAINCGFNSSNYFKDCFRRINGISPRAYRHHSSLHNFEMTFK